MKYQTFTYKEILERVQTCLWGSKGYKSSCFPETFSMIASGSSL